MDRPGVNVDFTGNCPVDLRCGSCGAYGAQHRVVPMETSLGVHCLTLCLSCIEKKLVPTTTGVAEACVLTARHCEHLGIAVEEMARILASEQR